MNCVQCGVPVPDEARFCHSCGSQVSDAEGQARASGAMDDESLKHVEELLREDSSDEFAIHKLLGRGGMALVFLATETRLARKVAIKVLPPELTFGHGVERFMREAKMAAALDHPHIIPVYRIASGSKIFWYAMKYLEGRSLDDVLKEQGKLSLEESIKILAQVADALDYAHERSVIHRDIKPANVMLDSRQRVIVTDFGIAKALTESNLTASGSVVGTPYYMSPEQGMGRGVSGRSDQYSVAVMAYRMISGQVPFEGDSAIDILHKHCMVAAPRMETVAPGLPEHVYKAVHKALEKKPELRFKNVSSFVEALRHHTADLEVSSESATVMVSTAAVAAKGAASAPTRPSKPTPATPPTPIPTARGVPVVRPTRSRAPMAVGVAAVLLIGVGAGGYFMFLRDKPGTQTTETPGGTGGQPSTPAPTTGHLTVANLPAGGEVSVGGVRQPGAAFDVPQGRHELVITVPGYQDVRVQVTVFAGEQQTVPYTGQRAVATRTDPVQPPADRRASERTTTATRGGPPTGGGATRSSASGAASKGALRISIQQGWAMVSVDGVSKGRQPRLVDSLPVGDHFLRFERDGFATFDTTVAVRAGEEVRFQVKLQPPRNR